MHNGILNLQVYYYYIVAVDTSSNPSQPSMTVSGIPDIDTDEDGIGNFMDDDDDNDGHRDSNDAYPLDPEKWKKDEGLPWLLLILTLLVVAIVVIVAIVTLKKQAKKRMITKSQSIIGVPSTAPVFRSFQTGTVPQYRTSTPPAAQPLAVQAQSRYGTVPIAQPFPRPFTQTPKLGAKVGQMIRCPRCTTVFTVESPERPIEINCPNCGTRGLIS